MPIPPKPKSSWCGPASTLSSHLRGFDVDGGVARPRTGVNAIVFPGATHGCNVAAGDFDVDGLDEVTCGPGPDPLSGSSLATFRASGSSLVPVPSLTFDVFGSSRGVRVSAANLD